MSHVKTKCLGQKTERIEEKREEKATLGLSRFLRENVTKRYEKFFAKLAKFFVRVAFLNEFFSFNTNFLCQKYFTQESNIVMGSVEFSLTI